MTKFNLRHIGLIFALLIIQTSCNLPTQRLVTPPAIPSPYTVLPPEILSNSTTAPILLPTGTLVPTTGPAVRILGQHEIRAGETLYCIARVYGVLPSAIVEANNITNPDSLLTGQILNIPQVQWIDIPPGPICSNQFNSPFPGGPPAVPLVTTAFPVSTTAVPIPITTSPPPNYADLERELFLSLGGGGGQETDCSIVYTVDSQSLSPLPAIRGFFEKGIVTNSGKLCLFGFPLDSVLTVSLFDRRDGNALHKASFIVREQEVLQINSSGQVTDKAGSASIFNNSVSIIDISVWPDPLAKFVRVSTTNLQIDSDIQSLKGIIVDFPNKSTNTFDPFGWSENCADIPVGHELSILGSGFEANGVVTIDVLTTTAGTGTQSNYGDAVHYTNDPDAYGGTLLGIDKNLTSYVVTTNGDGRFQIVIPTTSLLPTGLYFVQVEYRSTTLYLFSRDCFTITNRQVIYGDHLSTPPVIDGDTQEWATLMDLVDRVTFGSQNWSGFDDVSAWFSVGWDETFLYIAASIVDDHYIQTQRDNLIFLGDSIDMLLGDPIALQAGLRSTDYQLGFSLGNLQTNDPPDQPYLWYPTNKSGWPLGVIGMGKQKAKGYDVEIAIPWAFLERVPAPGQQYRFVFSVSDNDTEGATEQQSLISSIATRVLADPTTWGVLLLSD